MVDDMRFIFNIGCQIGYVKDIMHHLILRGKGKLIGTFFNFFQDLKGTHISWAKLPFGLGDSCNGLDLQKTHDLLPANFRLFSVYQHRALSIFLPLNLCCIIST